MQRLKRSPFLRRAVEDLRVQVSFHVVGGVGLGLLLAQITPNEPAALLGALFIVAALMGHWYALWSDPSRR